MLRTLLIMGLAAVPALAAAAPPPGWKVYADCAAGYHANSQLKDPSRPSGMAAMISDQAGDYQKAALKAYTADPANAKHSRSYGETFVSTYVERRSPAYSKLSRDDLDRFLDTCPQLEVPG